MIARHAGLFRFRHKAADVRTAFGEFRYDQAGELAGGADGENGGAWTGHGGFLSAVVAM